METYPLKSMSLYEAQEKQFKIVDIITKNMRGKEFLQLGDLGITQGLNKPNKTKIVEKIIAENEKEEKHFKKLSGSAREAIDERLLYSYDRIRTSYRNGLAVVPVERDACGGCFNSIPPQRQSEIRLHKKVIVCENCGRILVDADLNDSIEVK